MTAYAANGAVKSDAQAMDAAVITPSDSTVLAGVRGIYVGVAGNITVVTDAARAANMKSGTAITPVQFTNVPAGFILPLHVAQVMAATTATGLVALIG